MKFQVELCGHATLAAAHFLFTSVLLGANTIEFSTLSGVLTAKRVLEGLKSDPKDSQNGEAHESFFIELDFPVVPTATVEFNGAELQLISKALNGASVTEIKKTTTGDDLLVRVSIILYILCLWCEPSTCFYCAIDRASPMVCYCHNLA